MDVEIGGFCALLQIRKHEYHGGKDEFGGERLMPSEELRCQRRSHPAPSKVMVLEKRGAGRNETQGTH